MDRNSEIDVNIVSPGSFFLINRDPGCTRDLFFKYLEFDRQATGNPFYEMFSEFGLDLVRDILQSCADSSRDDNTHEIYYRSLESLKKGDTSEDDIDRVNGGKTLLGESSSVSKSQQSCSSLKPGDPKDHKTVAGFTSRFWAKFFADPDVPKDFNDLPKDVQGVLIKAWFDKNIKKETTNLFSVGVSGEHNDTDVKSNPINKIGPYGLWDVLSSYQAFHAGCRLPPSSQPIPGFNYCGPGSNGLPPSGPLDQACKNHDECYEECGLDSKDVEITRPGQDKGPSCQDDCDDDLCREAGIHGGWIRVGVKFLFCD